MTAALAKFLSLADDEPSRITLREIIVRPDPCTRVSLPWSFTAVPEAARRAVIA